MYLNLFYLAKQCDKDITFHSIRTKQWTLNNSIALTWEDAKYDCAVAVKPVCVTTFVPSVYRWGTEGVNSLPLTKPFSYSSFLAILCFTELTRKYLTTQYNLTNVMKWIYNFEKVILKIKKCINFAYFFKLYFDLVRFVKDVWTWLERTALTRRQIGKSCVAAWAGYF